MPGHSAAPVQLTARSVARRTAFPILGRPATIWLAKHPVARRAVHVAAFIGEGAAFGIAISVIFMTFVALGWM